MAKSFPQQYNREKNCHPDTIIVSIDRRHLIKTDLPDSVREYKAFRCTQVSPFGFRVDIGIAHYHYAGSTSQWIGNHFAPSLGLTLAYKKMNFGARFKPWTVRPGSRLSFNNDTLPTSAKLNPVKIDYFFGYSIDLSRNISVEPYAGLSTNIFNVINEKELNQSFDIPKVTGMIGGVYINKYFTIRPFKFISTFINAGYSSANFKKVHNQLDRGYFEWSVGVGYKVFGKRHFSDRIQ